MTVRDGLLVGVSLVLSLAAAEVGLRLLAPVGPEGFEVAPETAAIRYATEQNLPGLKPQVVYERNDYGLRTRSVLNGTKVPGLIRILCLGGSTADQPTQDFADTWCGRLESEGLRTGGSSGPGPRFETAIHGRGGYRGVDLLAWVEDSLDAVQPDMVIVLLGINDLVWAGGPEYRYQGLDSALASSRRARGPREARVSLARRLCPESLQLCRRLILLKRSLARNAIEWHSANLPELRRQYQALPSVDDLRRNPDPAVEFEAAMDSLAATLAARGIRALFLGQPTLWSPTMGAEEQATLWFGVATPEGKVRPSGRWLAAEMSRYNAIQETIARRHGFLYLDLGDRIPRSLEYFFDDCHFTDLGSALVSTEIMPLVIKAAEPLSSSVP